MASECRLSELDGGPCTVRPSVYAHIEEGVVKSLDGAAIVVMHQASDHLSALVPPSSEPRRQAGCLSWTYAQLHSAALRVAAGLAAHGVQTGEMLMAFMPNGVEYPVLLWAASMLKVALVNLDPGALGAARTVELENYLRTLRPEVVLVTHAEGAKAVDMAVGATGIQALKAKVCFNGLVPEDWKTLPQLAADGDKLSSNRTEMLEAARHDNPGRLVFVLFTSGTSSGKPKGCPRHVAAVSHVLETNPYNINEARGKPVRFLMSTPNYRAIASLLGIATWKAGGTVVMPPPSSTGGFNAAGTLDAIQQHCVTTLHLIPVMLHGLTAHPSFSSSDLSSVAAVWMGGDIITKDFLAKASDAFRHCQVSCSHGMTEIGRVVTWPFFGKAIDRIPCFGNICPIGAVMPGVRALVLNNETQHITKRGEPGELCFSANTIIKHYLGNVKEELFFTDDKGRRWYRTGDLGVIDDNGVIFIVARIKDIIKRGGLSITPMALEASIETFTGEETCVVAAPHAELGQEPFVVLKTPSNKTDDEIRAHVVDTFGKEYALGGIASLKQLGLDEFPMNAAAKILKFDIEKRVVALREKAKA